MVVHVCAVGIGEVEARRSDQEEPGLYGVLQDSQTQPEILFLKHTHFIKDKKELYLVLWPCNWNLWGWYHVEIWPLRGSYKVSPEIGPLKVVHNVSSALLSALFKYDTLIPEKAAEEFSLFPFLCMSKLRCRASELQKWASSQSSLSLCFCMLMCARIHTI